MNFINFLITTHSNVCMGVDLLYAHAPSIFVCNKIICVGGYLIRNLLKYFKFTTTKCSFAKNEM